MSITRSFTLLVSSWIFVVLASLVARAVMIGAPPSLPESLGWLFVGCAPVIIFLSVFRGGGTSTVAKTLYEVEHATDADLLKARISDVRR